MLLVTLLDQGMLLWGLYVKAPCTGTNSIPAAHLIGLICHFHAALTSMYFDRDVHLRITHLPCCRVDLCIKIRTQRQLISAALSL